MGMQTKFSWVIFPVPRLSMIG